MWMPCQRRWATHSGSGLNLWRQLTSRSQGSHVDIAGATYKLHKATLLLPASRTQKRTTHNTDLLLYMCLFFLNFSLILIASCLIAMFALLILAMRRDGLRRAEIFVCLFMFVKKLLLNLARLFTEIKWNVTPFIVKHFSVTVRTGWNTSSPAVFQIHYHVLILRKCEHRHGHGSSSSMGGTASIVYLLISKEMHVNTVLSIPSIIPKKMCLEGKSAFNFNTADEARFL